MTREEKAELAWAVMSHVAQLLEHWDEQVEIFGLENVDKDEAWPTTSWRKS